MVAICNDRRSTCASALVTSRFRGASDARCSAACRRAACGVGLAAPLAFDLRAVASGPPRSARQLRAIAVHVAIEGLHRAVPDKPQLVRTGFNDVTVMGDQDNRPLVIIERADQGFARVHIKMVGRLVEDQQMRAVKRGQANSRRTFSPPELLGLRIRLADAEAERAEPGAALRLRRVRHQIEHVLVRRSAGRQVVHLVLGEIAEDDLVRRVTSPAIGAKRPAISLANVLLPLPLTPSSADAIVGVEPEIEILRRRMPSMSPAVAPSSRISGLANALAGLANRNGATRSSICSAIGCTAASALMRLCACVALEAFALKRVMNASMCPRWSSCFFFSLRSRRCFSRRGLLELVVAAGVKRELALCQVQDGANRAVQQVAVVADDEARCAG